MHGCFQINGDFYVARCSNWSVGYIDYSYALLVKKDQRYYLLITLANVGRFLNFSFLDLASNLQSNPCHVSHSRNTV